tara:strand:+ start:1432 stop:1779 length:348 start_codon:yes stop_codon:yes gene_type:complete
MADDKKTIEVDGIPNGTLVTIEVDTNLHTRLAQLLMENALNMGTTDFAKFFDEMQSRDPKNNAEYHLYTLLMIVQLIEEQYVKTGKIIKMNIPSYSDKEIKSSDSSDVSETPDEN